MKNDLKPISLSEASSLATLAEFPGLDDAERKRIKDLLGAPAKQVANAIVRIQRRNGSFRLSPHASASTKTAHVFVSWSNANRSAIRNGETSHH